MDQELRQYLDDMTAKLCGHISDEFGKVETKLVSAFHGWTRSMENPELGRRKAS
jgi:hypothetical protein